MTTFALQSHVTCGSATASSETVPGYKLRNYTYGIKHRSDKYAWLVSKIKCIVCMYKAEYKYSISTTLGRVVYKVMINRSINNLYSD